MSKVGSFRSGLHVFIVALAFLTTLSLSGATDSKAAIIVTNQKALTVALLGDSYSAGNGAGGYYGEPGAYLSYNNWAHHYVNWLNSQGIKTTLNSFAYDGKTSTGVREQVDKVSENTDLVMMTAGGNDVNFGGIVLNCFVFVASDGRVCRDLINDADSKLDSTMSSTKLIFEDLEDRLSSDARVILVGYPLLSTDSDYVLRWCNQYTLAGNCIAHDSYDVSAAVRAVGQKATQKQAELVAEWNANHAMKAIYVDNINEAFAGHEPNPSQLSRNSQRWINEFFETEGRASDNGDTEAIFSPDYHNWYHPNVTGHQKIADQIVAKVGIPSSAHDITTNSSDIDVAFVVDTSKSMGPSLFQVKQDIKQAAFKYRQQARTIRFALIDYRDQSSYVAQVQSDFTYDVNAFNAAVDNLWFGNDDTNSASFHSGAMTAMDLNWRAGVRKLIVAIGNLPAQDPEPFTNYTWQAVRQKTYEMDPVEVYAIDNQGSALTDSIADLVNGTGGQTFSNANNVYDAASDIIDHSTNKPFGWIQGPYIVKVGQSLTLDARASYAVIGSIASIDWDLDGDSVFETHSSDLLYEHLFTIEFSGTIGVRITDTNGEVGIGSTHLDVTDDGDSIPRSIDNCPDIANQNQADFDNDGIGDDCDSEVDYSSLIITYDDEVDDQTNSDQDLVNQPQTVALTTTPVFALATFAEPNQFTAGTSDEFSFNNSSTVSNQANDLAKDIKSDPESSTTLWMVVIITLAGVMVVAVTAIIYQSKKPSVS